MSYEVEYLADEGFVRVTVHKPITAELQRRFAADGIAAAKRKGVHHYIVDARRVANIASPIDQSRLAYKELTQLLTENSRIAILIAKGDRSHDFIETAMRNAGHNCRLFIDETSARDWLTGRMLKKSSHFGPWSDNCE